jgi:hypothetical protein
VTIVGIHHIQKGGKSQEKSPAFPKKASAFPKKVPRENPGENPRRKRKKKLAKVIAICYTICDFTGNRRRTVCPCLRSGFREGAAAVSTPREAGAFHREPRA